MISRSVFYILMVLIPAAAGYVGGTYAANRAYFKLHKRSTELVDLIKQQATTLHEAALLHVKAKQAYDNMAAQLKHLQKSVNKQVKVERYKKKVTKKLLREIDARAEEKAREIVEKERGTHEI